MKKSTLKIPLIAWIIFLMHIQKLKFCYFCHTASINKLRKLLSFRWKYLCQIIKSNLKRIPHAHNNYRSCNEEFKGVASVYVWGKESINDDNSNDDDEKFELSSIKNLTAMADFFFFFHTIFLINFSTCNRRNREKNLRGDEKKMDTLLLHFSNKHAYDKTKSIVVFAIVCSDSLLLWFILNFISFIYLWKKI
jgi:hypothetical protein